jgi:hypothetical protein
MLLILVILLTMSMLTYSINACENPVKQEQNNNETTDEITGETKEYADDINDVTKMMQEDCDSSQCEGDDSCSELETTDTKNCECEENENSCNCKKESDPEELINAEQTGISSDEEVPEEETKDVDVSDEEYTEENLSDVERQLIEIIEAFANHYHISNYEAAELIYNMMQLTLEQGGIVEIDENGSLIFDTRVTIEVLYSGRILINGFDIIAEQAEEYNISYDDSVEVINALFEITLIDSHFTIERSDENGVLFVYSIITEITRDGVIIIDGQVVENDEIDDAVDDIEDEAEEIEEKEEETDEDILKDDEFYIDPGDNIEDSEIENEKEEDIEIKALNNSNEAKNLNSTGSNLPVTGEETKIILYVIGGIIFLSGNVVLLKKLKKDI